MPDSPEKKETLPFLPARESTLFSKLFEWYTDWLFWRRFDTIHIQSDYKPDPGQKTIYYLNHSSWWDGLIPFLLNQKKFRQNARGMMEDKQLHRYPFFRRLGVFSINLSSPRSSMQSMRYAVKSMQRPNASLYIYPQGKIVPFSIDNLNFQKGIGWLAKKIPDADIVPVAIYIHTKKSDKPRLEILVGEKVEINRKQPPGQISKELEIELTFLLDKFIKKSHD
ncbi:hypothetical protein BH23BAC3_BH23BAC3_16390 [soil metagenome]